VSGSRERVSRGPSLTAIWFAGAWIRTAPVRIAGTAELEGACPALPQQPDMLGIGL